MRSKTEASWGRDYPIFHTHNLKNSFSRVGMLRSLPEHHIFFSHMRVVVPGDRRSFLAKLHRLLWAPVEAGDALRAFIAPRHRGAVDLDVAGRTDILTGATACTIACREEAFLRAATCRCRKNNR
ncbi:hypothetical protein RCIA49 [Methanocella arvoryzae MRE50]|uniref:Uncharacterized protein n=1 Tax=Methanocella arvoryzae (strain DSM 22066 / NBRC 105507 / MRE50) TaxID=351160 RepID=Q0W5W3_METAR|nr:hypothetical protein RCIA49 [Methanocella arvoryzae MRE50]